MKGCRPLTDLEAEAVNRAFAGSSPDRERAAFALGLYTGERISAILQLRVGDVIKAGRVADVVTYRRSSRKGKREGRTLPLNPKAKAALAAWIDALAKRRTFLSADDYLFQGRKGTGPISRVQYHRALHAAVDAAGLAGPVASHSARKTFANRVHIKLGRDIFRTQHALGHANIGSTVAYLSFLQDDIDAAVMGL